MNILGALISPGIKGALSGIGGLAKDIRTAITGKNPELEAKLKEMEMLAYQAQTDINLAEAKHPSLFVSGWRPAVGWICALGLFWQFIGFSLFEWIVKLTGSTIVAPNLHTEGLFALLMALLGVGGYRSLEKIKGVARN